VLGQLKEPYKGFIELQTSVTPNNIIPFWMRSNQFGSVPLSGVAGSAILGFAKDFKSSSQNSGPKKLVDWGFGFESRVNGGKGSKVLLIETYVKAKLSIFQLKGGRSKDVMGLNGDTILSSGNFAVSGNAISIPKIEISVPKYYRIPVFEGLFSFKGTFSHGWIGHAATAQRLSTFVYSKDTIPYTYFHQKSFYGRLGKPEWKLQLYGGFNHQVFWGSEKDVYGSDKFDLSPMQTFLYVASGKAYGGRNSGVERSKIGNQLGSIDIGVEYSFKDLKFLLYRQSFYDIGALSKLANIQDGLNGISVENLNYHEKNRGLQFKTMLFEVFYSKNQAGYPWSALTKSGDENYYNNYYYSDGWSYKGTGLGNPLITKISDAKRGQAVTEGDPFLNNRIIAFHAGGLAQMNDWYFTGKLTFSKNYGTFGTSIYGHSLGNIRHPQTENIFTIVNQTSLYLQISKDLKKNLRLGLAFAVDNGGLLNNSIGTQLSVSKKL
jgi:hypothetical protein